MFGERGTHVPQKNWVTRYPDLINEVVNGLTKLSSSTTLIIIDCVQFHSVEVANTEVIEVLPQQENANTNDEQTDANVNINDSFAEISSLELATSSTNSPSTNNDGQTLDITNENNLHLPKQVLLQRINS